MKNKKTLFVASLFVGLIAVCASARVAGGGGFSATAVLWFYGEEVTAAFTGELSVSGSVTVAGEAIPFTADGSLHGSAEGDTATLTGVGWGIFTGRGRTSTGEEVKLYGGLTADTDDVSISNEASGAGSALFIALIIVGDERLKGRGIASASAIGSFVPPEDPYTMELSGTGSISFQAATTVPLDGRSIKREELPWSLSGWPSDLMAELLSLLGIGDPDEGEEGDGPDWVDQGF